MMRRILQVALAALTVAAFARVASAQVYTGRIEISAVDASGAVMAGVRVDAAGVMSTVVLITDARGQAHFLNLPPGKYVVTGKKTGFGDYKNDDVPVGAGSTVTLQLVLQVGAVSAASEVKATTPVIEAKRTNVATNVSVDELQGTPSARDPWVVLQTVPGVIVDRVNVGGTESGQQSVYMAKGAGTGENTWNMDGVAITDMAALGSSPTYYDFDMFQEMQVTTGGGDPSVQTAGVQLNFVLRSGTNAWRVHGRYYFANHSMQSNNLAKDQIGVIQSYNRVNQLTDFGAEGGGPVVQNRLFVWAAYGKTNPRNEINSYQNSAANLPVLRSDCSNTGTKALSTVNTYAITARDCTILENISTKITGEIDSATRLTFAYFRGNKLKFGRSAGATRPDETTWNQKGPTSLYKGDFNRTIGSDLFMTVRVSHTSGGFSLTPRGGETAPFSTGDAGIYRDDAKIYHGSFVSFSTNRPQDSVGLDANYFKGAHELKFGFGWRKAAVTSQSFWPGGEVSRFRTYPAMRVQFTRDFKLAGDGVYMSGYLGDTLNRDRWTLNLGVRWDRSAGSVGAASVPANKIVPTKLPAVTAPAINNAIVWNSVTPRVGLTYALTKSRKTIGRMSYAMFASQLDSNRASIVASAIPYYSYVYYDAVDLNGDKIAQANELGAFKGAAISGAATIGKYSVPKTHEILLGLEQEVAKNVGASVTYTYRRFTGFNWEHYTGITGASYIEAPDSPLTGFNFTTGAYKVPFYVLNAPLPDTQIYETRPGYYQKYQGLELALMKRMSNRWMARLGFSTNIHREYFKNDASKVEPTSTPTHPNVNGGIVVTQTAGSGKSAIYLVLPKYQFIMLTQYQGRYGINWGLNYSFRQGYAEPFFSGAVSGSEDDINGGGKDVLIVSDVSQHRLATLHSVDMRLSKTVRFSKSSIDLDLDFFNLFNLATVLGRQYDAAASTFNLPQEIMNPRVIRFGVRLGWQ